MMGLRPTTRWGLTITGFVVYNLLGEVLNWVRPGELEIHILSEVGRLVSGSS